MGLFHNILAAIDNPEQEASPEGLGSIFDTLQDLASTNQINPVALQSAMSIVGNYTRSAIRTMLPVLVPLVLKLLKTGNNSANSLNSNSVLNSFLDADGDGDVDLADAMKMTAKYLNS